MLCSRSVRVLLAAGVAVTVGGYAPSARAQPLSPSQRPKPASYPRYVVPGQCLSAVRRETRELWRGNGFYDTLAYTAVLKGELIPPSVVRAAQQCLTQLQTVARRPDQHVAMVRLAEFAQRGDLRTLFLDSAMARVAAERDNEERSWRIARIVRSYPGGAGGEFFTLLDAAELARYTDPLRDPESLARLLPLAPCEDVTSCWARWNTLAVLHRDVLARGDFATATRYADSLVAVKGRVNGLPSTSRDATGRVDVFSRIDYFQALANWFDDTTLVAGPADAQAVSHVAWERVRNRLRDVGDNPDNPFPGWAMGNRNYFFMDSLFRLNATAKFPTLTPQAWMGRTGPTSAPAQGRVLLIIDRPIVAVSPGLIAMVRRLHSKYAASGVDVVWVLESQGHLQGNSVLTFDEEQKKLAAYLLNHHRAPGIIALDQTTFGKRADNRLVPQSASLGATAALRGVTARSGDAVRGIYIVDRNGNLRMPRTTLLFEDPRYLELVLSRMIERAL